MTEDEAKTKWCPMVRHGGDEYMPASNRWSMGANPNPKWGTETSPSVCRCIASECMWWVWDADWNDISADIQEGRENYKQRPCGHCGAIK